MKSLVTRADINRKLKEMLLIFAPTEAAFRTWQALYPEDPRCNCGDLGCNGKPPSGIAWKRILRELRKQT
jgi:hypothetical protein